MLIVIVQVCRFILRPGRYLFFAIGQFGLRNAFTIRGRLKLAADAAARKALVEAQTYDEYVAAADRLDALEKSSEASLEGKHRVQRMWNQTLVESKIAHMTAMREQNDDRGLLGSLRLALDRNFGGISHPSMYTYTGVPRFPQVCGCLPTKPSARLHAGPRSPRRRLTVSPLARCAHACFRWSVTPPRLRRT